MTTENEKWLEDNGFKCEKESERFVVTAWKRDIVTADNGADCASGYRLYVTRMRDRLTDEVTWHGTAGNLNGADDFYSDGAGGKGPEEIVKRLASHICKSLEHRIADCKMRIREVRRQTGLKDKEAEI